MAWTILILAGLFEIGWAIGLKYTDGFTRITPSVLTAVSMVISVMLLGLALRELPVGSAYAVWTGIGTVGTALLGMYLFAEPATVIRLVCIGLIVSGIGGLKFLT
ncbi:quaternary ammonium compound-resistance protein SugE [Phyllobacterium brassicacearum]|uniref:Guanidinium exporter n=1 Tax=Phyllobacterium brassicacearum TaxID=314235 RepID=A0A2P7BPP9_9HYPH|nr:quaternary ammonium compound efflux SMR transporter SugE [Phyllobacterium brassicacearum]PSH68458.1 quaternary ammonium compound-resistance protein SugE [Phyllobacterium brassicacearum]TDQ31824.1 quaternary ammonium compound-resistance protein SugE [Phyllobacterium brassicacearum]